MIYIDAHNSFGIKGGSDQYLIEVSVSKLIVKNLSTVNLALEKN